MLGAVLGGYPETASCLAEERVVVRERDGRATREIRGDVVDWTGQALTIRRAGAREESVASSLVVEVQRPITGAESTADEQYSQGNWEAALGGYQAAWREADRPWVKRRILSRAVWTLRNLERTVAAAEMFLRIVQEDPTTIHLAAIPLPWSSEELPGDMPRAAEAWLSQRESAVARLLGAAWLIPTAQRGTALAALQNLSQDADARIAALATGQLWRTQVATVNAETLDRWQATWQRMPGEQQPGPAFVLGQAQARQQRPAEAALCYLRAPLLQPENRRLAAAGLLAAGRELEKAAQPEEAARLFREVVARFPESPEAQSVKGR